MPAWKVRGYTIETLLGRGGSGEVWRGRVTRSGAAVALKRVPVAVATDLAEARREAAVLAALDHPNLVRVHDFVLTDGAAVLVMDLAEGGTLAALLEARGRLTPGEVITALAPVAAALAHAHAAAVVHGDVSAANVLFSERGLPMLADLGVARLVGERRAARCTPAYVDPAVAAGAPPSPHSDVFMLGGVALHALTGEPTWRADAGDLLDRARGGELDDVAERLASAGVPEAMARVVERALAVDPHRRGTAADFALDLRHSGEPLAVELRAGRARPDPRPGPRHAARPASDRLPPTRMVAPLPRPVLPRQPEHRWRRRNLVVAALVVACAAAAGWVAFASSTGASRSARGSAAPAGRAAAAPASWLGALRSLDRRRAQAYARRDPRLLAQVYAAPALLRQDAATLLALTAPGCGITGLHTAYERPQVTVRGAGRAVVTVSARVAPSVLSCPGNPARPVAGTVPTTLRIELVRTRHGPRIASLEAG